MTNDFARLDETDERARRAFDTCWPEHFGYRTFAEQMHIVYRIEKNFDMNCFDVAEKLDTVFDCLAGAVLMPT